MLAVVPRKNRSAEIASFPRRNQRRRMNDGVPDSARNKSERPSACRIPFHVNSRTKQNGRQCRDARAFEDKPAYTINARDSTRLSS